MKIRSFRYYINEAFRGLLRNRLMAFASIATVASCLFMFSLSFCVVSNLDGFMRQLESTVGLTVYIDDAIDAEAVNSLHTKVKALKNVKYVKYVSAEEALEQFRSDLGDDSALLEGLERDNPLPRSFNIEMIDPKEQSALVKALENLSGVGVSEIRYQERVVEAITAINKGVSIASVVAVIVLLAVSVVIITNTIKITVNSRRTEINIMKYVGATDWFIRWPFIIEGMLIGIIGSLIPILICLPGYARLLVVIYEHMPMLKSLINFKSSYDVFSVLMPANLGFGIVIGVTGSLTSIRKHLKV